MASLFESFPQFPVVINFAVKNDPFCPIGVMYRLLAACEIDDRQSPHREPHILIHVKAILVRSAMNDGAAHCLEQFTVCSSSVSVYKSGNSAHRLDPSTREPF